MANTEWRRADFFVELDDQAWNTKQMVTIEPGESVLRVRWGIQLAGSTDDVSGFWPTGNIVVKAGILYDAAGIAVDTAPTPISQPGDDWLDMCFMPWTAVMDLETTIGWSFQTHIQQREARERRDNPSDVLTDDAVYLCWEWLNGSVPAAISYERTGSVDVLVLMP